MKRTPNKRFKRGAAVKIKCSPGCGLVVKYMKNKGAIPLTVQVYYNNKLVVFPEHLLEEVG